MLAPSLASGWSIDVCNLGVCGEKSSEIKKRAPYSGKWDVVVLLAGTNDLSIREADSIWTNLQEMYVAFEHANTAVVAVTVPRIRIVSRLIIIHTPHHTHAHTCTTCAYTCTRTCNHIHTNGHTHTTHMRTHTAVHYLLKVVLHHQ